MAGDSCSPVASRCKHSCATVETPSCPLDSELGVPLRPLLPVMPRVYFALNFGALSCLLPYMGVFLKSRGLSPPQIGWCGALRPLSIVFTAPLGTMAVESRRSPLASRFIVFTFAVGASCMTVLLLNAPSGSFSLLFAIIAGLHLFATPLVPLLDGVALSTLTPETKATMYGRIRLWGSLSWGLFSLSTGLLSDYLKAHAAANQWVLGMMLSAALSCLFAVLFLLSAVRWPTQQEYMKPDGGDALLPSTGRRDSDDDDDDDEHRHHHDSALMASRDAISSSSDDDDHCHDNDNSGDVGDEWQAADSAACAAAEQQCQSPDVSSSSDALMSNSGDASPPPAEREPPAVDAEQLPFGVRLRYFLGAAFADFEFCWFLVIVALCGFAHTQISNWLFIYIESLQGSPVIMGISVVCTIATEVPVFFVSGALIKRVGAPALLAAALMAYSIRVAGYVVVSNPWWILPFELLQGLSFGGFWAASMSIMNDAVPPVIRSSAQGIFFATYQGIGASLGTIIGGVLFDAFGPRALYLSMGLAVVVGNLSWLLVKRRFFITLCRTGRPPSAVDAVP